MSSEKQINNITYTWTPKYKEEKNGRNYNYKIYIPGVYQNSLDMSVEYKTKSLLLTGYKGLSVTDEIYKKIYNIEIPNGYFKLEIPFPNDELDYDSIRFSFNNGTMDVNIPLMNNPAPKRILLKKGTLSI